MSIYVTKSFMPPIKEYTKYIESIYSSGVLTNQGPLTDYSSAYIDAMYLDKPFFCFCYDYDNYKDVEKGFLYDLDSVFPSQKQTSFVELLTYIQSEIDSGTQTQSLSYQQIKKFFFQYTDGDNCKRIISLIEH